MHTISKCWEDSKTEGVMKNKYIAQWWITVHFGLEIGSIPEVYPIFKSKTNRSINHHEKNFENFSKWVREILVPTIPPKFLKVLQSAPYHSIQINKPLTLSLKKVEI
jgi:hypothetical protein